MSSSKVALPGSSNQLGSINAFKATDQPASGALPAQSAQDLAVVKLARDRWPNARNYSTSEPRNREISELATSNQDREPLIHTDKLNTSSPTLYVFGPNSKQKNPSQTSESRVSILAANYDPPEPIESQESRQSASDALVARLVVLNLEVGSSQATLTWSLSLLADSKPLESSATAQLQDKASSEQSANDKEANSKRISSATDRRAIIVKRDTIRVTPTLNRTTFSLSANKSADNHHSARVKLDDELDRKHKAAIQDELAKADVEPTDVHDQVRMAVRVADRSGDPLIVGSPESAKVELTRNGSVASNGDNLLDLPISKRLQLSRVQTLPASINKRPPSRAPQEQAASSTARPRRLHKSGAGRRQPVAASSASPSSSEPPMIRVTAVPINRIQQVAATTSSSISASAPTSAAERPASARAGKSLSEADTPSEPPPVQADEPAATSKSVRLSEPPPPRAEPKEEVAAAESKSQGRLLEQVDVSKWLVRLRRFASNEVDIVKVVVNNLSESARLMARAPLKPVLRYISFTSLEPSSAYEICVESASPNQQLADRYQVLDANHFLKCHDSSDVRLSNQTQSEAQSSALLGQTDASSDESNLFEQEEDARTKSLCKEFFTQPRNSSERLNFGQLDAGASRLRSASILAAENSTSSLRRPKSLAGALKSHMELLEINDIAAPVEFSPIFEVASTSSRIARPPQIHRLSSTASDSVVTRVHGEPAPTLQPMAPPANQAEYLTLSALPVVGCVFGLIFLITLANILLNAISCRSSSRARRRRPAAPRAGSLSKQLGKRALGSFYSDSDHSGSSQSRIVIVGANQTGKLSEPFGAANYFEAPAAPEQRKRGSGGHASSSSGSGGKHSASFLLSSGRFPLGPSFEGDGRHNADMVGLARKNYDHIINHIYNSDRPADRSPRLDGARNVPHGHLHHHHHHHRQHRQQRPDRRPANNQADCAPTRPDPELATSGQAERAASRKQRLRFDKINPIYNMEATGRRARQAPLQVSSFGHSNPSLSLEEPSSLATNEAADQCPLCAEARDRSLTGDLAPDLSFECDQESCHEEASYFTCCLDKQKQRFHKQQQQLERVLTKNGSLIPQPFINPSGPSRCATPTCESVARELELSQQANSIDGFALPNGEPDKKDTDRDRDRDKDEQELVAADAESGAQEKPQLFMFGQLEQSDQQSRATLPAQSARAPPAPTPPDFSQTLAKSPNKLVNVGAMADANSDEAQMIDKKDFNKRRNELASKLHLNGMTKPN